MFRNTENARIAREWDVQTRVNLSYLSHVIKFDEISHYSLLLLLLFKQTILYQPWTMRERSEDGRRLLILYFSQKFIHIDNCYLNLFSLEVVCVQKRKIRVHMYFFPKISHARETFYLQPRTLPSRLSHIKDLVFARFTTRLKKKKKKKIINAIKVRYY